MCSQKLLVPKQRNVLDMGKEKESKFSVLEELIVLPGEEITKIVILNHL